MPNYSIQGPDGKTYSIDGPEGATREQVIEQIKKRQAAPESGGGVGEFIKSIPTGAMNFASAFARGEQLESEQRAAAFGQPNAGPEIPTGDKATETFGLHKPKGIAGAAGELTGEFAANPLTYFGPGSAVAKFLTTAGAIAGGALGRESGFPGGETIGAVAGGGLPGAALKVAAPTLISDARQAAAQVLRSEGVEAVTAGQRTGSKALQYWEGYLGDAPFAGGRASAVKETQDRQFTQALLRRTGENAEVATPEVLDRAFTRIGGGMDALVAKSDTKMDQQFAKDVMAAHDHYLDTTSRAMQKPIIGKVLDDLTARLAKSPILTGEQAQALRSDLRALERSAFGDPDYAQALRGYIDALDDATERSLANPQDVLAWQRARSQYANLIPLAKAATGAGAGAAEGIISPAKMRQVLTATEAGKRDYARGRGPYSELVHAGNLVMTPLPNSGTAQREMARGFAYALTAMGGALLTGESKLGMGAIGVASGPGLMGRGTLSSPVQKYLSGDVPGQATARAAREQMPGAAATILRSAGPTAPDAVQQVIGGGP